jgi:hypothetical protein
MSGSDCHGNELLSKCGPELPEDSGIASGEGQAPQILPDQLILWAEVICNSRPPFGSAWPSPWCEWVRASGLRPSLLDDWYGPGLKKSGSMNPYFALGISQLWPRCSCMRSCCNRGSRGCRSHEQRCCSSPSVPTEPHVVSDLRGPSKMRFQPPLARQAFARLVGVTRSGRTHCRLA